MGDQNLGKLYSEILLKNGISDKISKVDVTVPQNLVGEHFGSICESVTIRFEAKPEPLHLFVKKMIPVTEPAQIEMMRGVMLKEAYFFNTVLKELKGICMDRHITAGKCITLGPDLETMFPKMYHADESAIVLEDLVKRGYKMINKKTKQDLEHATIVVTHLAKLHGVSHVLIQENGGKTDFLKDRPHMADWFLTPDVDLVLGAMLNPTVNAVFQILQESDVAGSSELLAKIEKYRGKWFSSIADAMRTDTRIPVVNHGDAWNNNMMALYGENEALQKIILLDMQVTRVASPAADLSYFIYTSVRSSVRKQWKTLLEIYYTELEETLHQFGQSPPLTFVELLEEFSKVGKVGLLFGFISRVGLEAMKKHDTDNQKESILDDKTGALQALVSEYIVTNPDKVRESVMEIISIAEDFEDAGGVI